MSSTGILRKTATRLAFSGTTPLVARASFRWLSVSPSPIWLGTRPFLVCGKRPKVFVPSKTFGMGVPRALSPGDSAEPPAWDRTAACERLQSGCFAKVAGCGIERPRAAGSRTMSTSSISGVGIANCVAGRNRRGAAESVYEPLARACRHSIGMRRTRGLSLGSCCLAGLVMRVCLRSYLVAGSRARGFRALPCAWTPSVFFRRLRAS